MNIPTMDENGNIKPTNSYFHPGKKTATSPQEKSARKNSIHPGILMDVDQLKLAARSDRWHRCKQCAFWIKHWRIYPHTFVQTMWILCTMFFVLWTAVLLPVTIAFIHSDNRPIWWETVDTAADVFFIFDVILNFRAVYLDTWGALITNSQQISTHYIFGAKANGFGWFWIDFPAAVPWSAFLSNDASSSFLGLRDTGYIFNVPKLARVFHLPSQISHLPCVKQGANTGRIFKLFFYFLIVAHWFGCLWYWVGSQDWCKVSCYENQGGNSDGACSWIDSNDIGHLPDSHLYVS